MSRHQIPGQDPNHTVFVGYDRGMKSFFAQVEDKEIERIALEAAERVSQAYADGKEPNDGDAAASECDSIIFWIGADRPEQVTTVEQLAAELESYAELTEPMRETLRGDQLREEERPRNEHERAMLNYVETGGGRALPLAD